MINSDGNIAGIDLKLGQSIDHVMETIAVKFQDDPTGRRGGGTIALATSTKKK
jgi:hypothetical protein